MHTWLHSKYMKAVKPTNEQLPVESYLGLVFIDKGDIRFIYKVLVGFIEFIL